MQGDGRLVEELRKLGFKSVGSDKKDGYDFILDPALKDKIVGKGPCNIVTNPWFPEATECVLRAFDVAHDKIAVLLPLQYCATVNRTRLFDKCPGDWKHTGLYPYCSKPKFTRPDGTEKALYRKPGPSNLEIAWFVWSKLRGTPDFRFQRIHRKGEKDEQDG